MTQTIEQLSFSEKFCQSKFKNGIDRQEAISKDWEQLTARVRELEEENARLKKEGSIYKNNNTVRQENHELRQKLLLAQAEIKLLRDALIATRDDLELRMQLTEDDSLNISNSVLDQMLDAIDIPASTEALDAYVAEKVKEYQERLADALAVLGADSQIEAEAVMLNYKKQVSTLTKQRDLAVEALHYCVKQVPELATVPGIATAIKESEGM